MKNTNVVLWWTDQAECEAIGERLPPDYPAYLRDQYASRYGRNGRGRLCVADEFGEVEVDPWPETPMARALGQRSAGIAVRAEDIRLLRTLPGLITDLRLDRA